MPSPDQVLAGLQEIATTWQPLAVLWHCCLALVVALLLSGWRPPRRIMGVFTALPLLSVAALAGLSRNPFNALVFALVGIAVLIIGLRLPRQPLGFSPMWVRGSGALLLAFGWVYPHFLSLHRHLRIYTRHRPASYRARRCRR